MDFSIITPSFRSLEWLKLCAASVADQNVPHEHIVQDSCSDDGTPKWLATQPALKAFVEKDVGMYDAINRGLKRASGDILAYLNCDEQYLPGTLERVCQYFDAHPNVDVLFADGIVVDSGGQFIAYRKAILPHKYHTWVGNTLAVFTCATFFRKRIVEQGLIFDLEPKIIGDVHWVLRLIEARVRMALLREFTSIFTDTGANLSWLPNAQREKTKLSHAAPWWARKLRFALIVQHRLRRLLHGAYRQKPFSYSIYTRDSPNERMTFFVKKPTFRWRTVRSIENSPSF